MFVVELHSRLHFTDRIVDQVNRFGSVAALVGLRRVELLARVAERAKRGLHVGLALRPSPGSSVLARQAYRPEPNRS